MSICMTVLLHACSGCIYTLGYSVHTVSQLQSVLSGHASHSLSDHSAAVIARSSKSSYGADCTAVYSLILIPI